MKNIFWVLTLIFITNCLAAENKASHTFAVLKAEFKQRRALTHVPCPIESKGVFVFIKGKGILWNVKEPYPKTVLISQTGIKNISQEDGKEPTPKSSGFGGYERIIGQILETVLNSNIDSIDAIDGFDCQSVSKGTNAWVKKLVPKDETIRQFVKSIQIEGSVYINRVEIQKAKGEWDELLFLNHNLCEKENHCPILDQPELKAFEQ